MANSVTCIEEDNLSCAWARAFLCVAESPKSEVSPLIVSIGDLDRDSIECEYVRILLDDYLKRSHRYSCQTIANTIFPQALWNPNLGREHVFERYGEILPRLKRYGKGQTGGNHRPNRNGTYFQRLIDARPDTSRQERGEILNQLEHTIELYRSGNHRRSALQASVFDPALDHDRSIRKGFPCMQHVFFAPLRSGTLQITGIYATQYLDEKAYGNYLGLFRLGRFMAHEMGLCLTRVICVANVAKLGARRKADLRELRTALEGCLRDCGIRDSK